MHINGHEVPAPLAADPEFHQWYWYPSLTKPLARQEKWFDATRDRERMQRGLVHETEDAAQAHAEALLSFTARDAEAPKVDEPPPFLVVVLVCIAIAALALLARWGA